MNKFKIQNSKFDTQNSKFKILLFCAMFCALFFALSADAFTPEEVVRKSQEAFFYPAEDFRARVLMKLINKDGKERVREMTMLRKNFGASGGDQKYFMYFHQPADVKDMTFMVYKYPVKDDDRWLFIPAVNMVRRIAAQDKTSSFVGSDFTYEDVSGRDLEDDAHEAVKEDKIDGQDCFVIKSTPKAGDMNYSYKLSWISKTSFLPLREEYYDRNNSLYRIFTADEIKEVKGIPTITKRTMKNAQSGHRTETVFINVDYNIGIQDDLFTERFLKRPPKKWIE